MKPLVRTKMAWKDYGYSILLKHDENGLGAHRNPGWHLFIHEADEPFSGRKNQSLYLGDLHVETNKPTNFALENRFQTSGRVEHMFIEVHEEVELKLTAQNYVMMPNIDSKCTEDPNKSISKVGFCLFVSEPRLTTVHSLITVFGYTQCGEICHWRRVADSVKCGGPWMDTGYPECGDYESTNDLINAYKEWVPVACTDCISPKQIQFCFLTDGTRTTT